MDTAYTFTKQVNSDQLKVQLVAMCAQVNILEATDLALVRIETVDTELSVWFNQELSESAETQLNTLLSDYAYIANYIPPEQQTQINTLIAYLNNANPTIANTARAVIVLNISPRLGADLICSINSQIATRLGG